MTECHDEKWNMRCEQLVKLKESNGHCVVPARSCEQDESLGIWVSKQQTLHDNDNMRLRWKSGSLGKLMSKLTATSSGTSSMKSWSSLNESMVHHAVLRSGMEKRETIVPKEGRNERT
jgi:hypothetical protein